MRYISFISFALLLLMSNPSYAIYGYETQGQYNERSNLEMELFIQQEEMKDLEEEAKRQAEKYEYQQRQQQRELDDLRAREEKRQRYMRYSSD